MALLRVRWTEAAVYEADIEVDGYDAEEHGKEGVTEEDNPVIEAILQREDTDRDFVFVEERSADVLHVLRDGDEPIEVKVSAPSYAPEF